MRVEDSDRRWSSAIPLLLILVLIAGTTAANLAGEPAQPTRDSDGTPAEPALRGAFDFRFRDINPASATFGEEISLAELYAERGIVLNFVASWCLPCWEELPHFQQLHVTEGVPIACIAADEYYGLPDDVLNKTKAANSTLPLLFVPKEQIERMEQHYDHDVLPSTYLIDRKGVIRQVVQGAISADELLERVEATLR